MKETSNLKLKKPDGTDYIDVDDFNYNFDIIDNKLQEDKKFLDGVYSLAHDADLKSKESYKKAEEAFKFASNGKDSIAKAITLKGVQASKNDTFEILSNKIKNISTEKPIIGLDFHLSNFDKSTLKIHEIQDEDINGNYFIFSNFIFSINESKISKYEIKNNKLNKIFKKDLGSDVLINYLDFDYVTGYVYISISDFGYFVLSEDGNVLSKNKINKSNQDDIFMYIKKIEGTNDCVLCSSSELMKVNKDKIIWTYNTKSKLSIADYANYLNGFFWVFGEYDGKMLIINIEGKMIKEITDEDGYAQGTRIKIHEGYAYLYNGYSLLKKNLNYETINKIDNTSMYNYSLNDENICVITDKIYCLDYNLKNIYTITISDENDMSYIQCFIVNDNLIVFNDNTKKIKLYHIDEKIKLVRK